MARVLFSAGARTDLKSIFGYTVDTWSAAQARRYLTGLRRKCELLAELPRMAPVATPGSLVRVALFGEHRIVYEPIAEGVEILRVVHQAQEFAAVLERLEKVREIIREYRSSSSRGEEPDEPET